MLKIQHRKRKFGKHWREIQGQESVTSPAFLGVQPADGRWWWDFPASAATRACPSSRVLFCISTPSPWFCLSGEAWLHTGRLYPTHRTAPNHSWVPSVAHVRANCRQMQAPLPWGLVPISLAPDGHSGTCRKFHGFPLTSRMMAPVCADLCHL